MTDERVGAFGEQALIRAIRARIAAGPHDGVLLGPGDDAALLACASPLAWTLDCVTAGVDWFPDRTPAEAIGHRAAVVNLSDLAAMGATPKWLLLGLELDPTTPVASVLRGVDGLVAAASAAGAGVVGGDVGFRAGPDAWTVTALGAAQGTPLRRDAARPGDRVWLIGPVGLAGLGLETLQREDDALASWQERALSAHFWPRPRVSAGIALAATGLRTAAIDVSDGLLLDAERVAAASGVRLTLDIDPTPWFDDDARREAETRGFDWRVAIAAGGDDYALLVTAAADRDVAQESGVKACWPVGRVLDGAGVELRVAGEAYFGPSGGYLHGESRLVGDGASR